MDPQSFIKPVVLTSVDVVTSFTVSHLLNKAAFAAMPDLKLWNEQWTRREKAIQVTKVVGLAIGAGVIAGLAGAAVRTTTERIFWNDMKETITIEPGN